MSFINKYLRNFEPYKVASHKIWQVTPDERQKIIKLDWNESTVPPSPIVKERLQNLLNDSFLNYYPASYNEELHRLLSDYVGIAKKYIQYFASSDSLHEYISKLYITVGDPVMILWPSYDNFRLTSQVAGANVMFFEMEKDFNIDKSKLEKTIEDKEPSLVYICNPNNPTGKIIDKEYIKSLLERYNSTMFLIDEAYIEFAEEYSCKDLVLNYDNILISRTMSKAFGLANIRFGYLLASADNINYISSIRNPKNITTFAQEAVIGALSNVDYMRSVVSDINKVKVYFINKTNTEFNKYAYAYPSFANFVLVRLKDLETKQSLLNYLEERNVFVRNVQQSDSVKNCIRITIGTLEQMNRVIELFEDYAISQK